MVGNWRPKKGGVISSHGNSMNKTVIKVGLKKSHSEGGDDVKMKCSNSTKQAGSKKNVNSSSFWILFYLDPQRIG